MLALTDSVRKKDRIFDAVEHLLLMSNVEQYDLKPSDTLYKAKEIRLSFSEKQEALAFSEELRGRLIKSGIRDFADRYLEEYALRKECSVVVEKTPVHLRFLPVIRDLFPQSNVVLIRRDKQQCLNSYFRTFGRRPGGLRFLPHSLARKMVWKQLLADEKREQWAVRHPWVKAVEYNHFIRCPPETVGRVAEWLGMVFDFGKYGHYFPDEPGKPS